MKIATSPPPWAARAAAIVSGDAVTVLVPEVDVLDLLAADAQERERPRRDAWRPRWR